MTSPRKSETDVYPVCSGHVVVFVDDDPAILSSLERLLRSEPYVLRTTLQPQVALEWVERGDVSIMVSDQRMPDMTGIEVIQEVWRRSPRTICLLITGYPESLHAYRGREAWVREMIEKPWDDRSLKRTLRQLLRERDLRDRRLAPAGQEGAEGRVL